MLATARRLRYHRNMRFSVSLIIVIALGTLLAGCSKCDPWWGEGRPGACRSAVPVNSSG